MVRLGAAQGELKGITALVLIWNFSIFCSTASSRPPDRCPRWIRSFWRRASRRPVLTEKVLFGSSLLHSLTFPVHFVWRVSLSLFTQSHHHHHHHHNSFRFPLLRLSFGWSAQLLIRLFPPSLSLLLLFDLIFEHCFFSSVCDSFDYDFLYFSLFFPSFWRHSIAHDTAGYCTEHRSFADAHTNHSGTEEYLLLATIEAELNVIWWWFIMIILFSSLSSPLLLLPILHTHIYIYLFLYSPTSPSFSSSHSFDQQQNQQQSLFFSFLWLFYFWWSLLALSFSLIALSTFPSLSFFCKLFSIIINTLKYRYSSSSTPKQKCNS